MPPSRAAIASDTVRANHYTVYDARIQVNDLLGREGLWMAVAGENLGDRVYRTTAIDFSAFGWTLNKYGNPRTVWFEAGMSLGEVD